MLVKRRPSWLALSKKPSYHNFILHHGKKSAADLCLCMLMHPRQGLLAFLLMMTVPHVRINKGLPVLLLMMAVPRVDRQVTIDEPHPAHPRLTPLVTAEARRNRRASMRPGRPTELGAAGPSYSSRPVRRRVPPNLASSQINDVDSPQPAPSIAAEARRKRKTSMHVRKPAESSAAGPSHSSQPMRRLAPKM